MIEHKDKIIQFKNYLQKNNYSDNSIRSYISDINKFFTWLNLNKLELNKLTLEAYVKHIQESLSTKTLARNVNTLKHYLKMAKLDDLNIFQKDLLTVKQVSKKPKFLNSDQIRLLQKQFVQESKIHTCISILLQTGIKISEICELKVKDFVNKSGKYFLLIKSDGREIPVNNKLLFVLKTYIAENKLAKNEYILQNNAGKRYHIRNLRGILTKSFSKINIKASVNDLRNTFIFEQLSAGNNLEYIQKIAGHRSRLATAKYLMYIKNYKDKGINEIIEL